MDTIDWSAVRFLFDLLSAAVMVVVGIYVWWTSRTRATRSAILEVHGHLEEVDRHIARIDQTLSNRPGYSEIEQLRTELASLNRGMAEIAAQMHSTTALLGRLHEYLLTEKGTRQ